VVRGRKPKPAKRQISEGDPRQRGKHKLDAKLAAEPAATKGLPYCPRHLKGGARTAWRFWAQELEAMDLDRRPDAMMLEGACVNYARAVQADRILDSDGLIVEDMAITKEGNAVVTRRRKHPAESVSARAWLLVRAFCSEFGLSPVSRTRLAIGKDGPKGDDLMTLLMKPRDKKPTAPTVH
jgi:P27 family predicted phage terminase small subunit